MNKLVFTILATTLVASLTGAEFESLPKDPPKQPSAVSGKQFVQVVCTTCHSKMVIDNAQKTRSAWIKTLEKMTDQGMPKLPKTIEASILDYLQSEQGEQSHALRKNRGPWADRRNANPLW